MTSLFRRLFATIAATFAIALPASATTYSIDYTDLWYAGQSEAGYGLNVVQQYNTIFATLYVYGPDSQPRWYFASGMTGSYTLASGDFPGSVAQKFKVTVKALDAANEDTNGYGGFIVGTVINVPCAVGETNDG